MNLNDIHRKIHKHKRRKRAANAATDPVLGMRKLSRILPHRYPMLLVEQLG